jgi:anti-sigma regulatory factor (Ser/Thr protein kinase)
MLIGRIRCPRPRQITASEVVMDRVPVPVDFGRRSPDTPADRATVTMVFGQADLPAVRAMVATAGTVADIESDDLDKLVLAVGEIAANAVVHGGGTGVITVERRPAGLRVEISDDGPGLPAGLVIDRPPPAALGGRGLWLAHLLCTNITVTSSTGGVTVTMLAEPRPHPADSIGRMVEDPPR